MSVQVSFIYCEEERRWQTIVSGPVEGRREVIQAFSSVVLTCQQLNPAVLPMSLATKSEASDGRTIYVITPAVES